MERIQNDHTQKYDALHFVASCVLVKQQPGRISYSMAGAFGRGVFAEKGNT
jgi:hypothetical protein